jgi:hypothetical protein
MRAGLPENTRIDSLFNKDNRSDDLQTLLAVAEQVGSGSANVVAAEKHRLVRVRCLMQRSLIDSTHAQMARTGVHLTAARCDSRCDALRAALPRTAMLVKLSLRVLSLGHLEYCSASPGGQGPLWGGNWD